MRTDAQATTARRTVTAHIRQEPEVMEKAAFRQFKTDVSGLIARAVQHLAHEGYGIGRGSCTVLLCDDPAITELNRQFRQKEQATNVLSFPSDDKGYLGDIAVSLPTCTREAAEQGKPLNHHLMHLTLHGFLHLLGFDHIDDAEAAEMEALETAILASFGIPDPYSLTITSIAQ